MLYRLLWRLHGRLRNDMLWGVPGLLYRLRERLRKHLHRHLHGRVLRMRRQLLWRLLWLLRWQLFRLLRWLLWRLFQQLLRRLQIFLHSDLWQHRLRRLVPRSLLCRLYNLVPDVLRLLWNELYERIEVRR